MTLLRVIGRKSGRSVGRPFVDPVAIGERMRKITDVPGHPLPPFSRHALGGTQHVLPSFAPGERSCAQHAGFRAQGGLLYLHKVT